MWVNGSLSSKWTCFWESLDIPEKRKARKQLLGQILCTTLVSIEQGSGCMYNFTHCGYQTHIFIQENRTSSFLLQTFSGPRHLCNWLFHYILGRAGHSECSIISTPHWAHMRSSSLSQVVHFVINNAAIAKEYRENV